MVTWRRSPFYTLYDRARALESREKQYSSRSDRNPSGDQQKPVRKEQKSGFKGRSGEGNLKNQSQGSQQSSLSQGGYNREVRKCYKCQEVGHIARNCPHSVEAPGRRLNASMTSSTNTVGSIQPVVPDEVTYEQLEQILMRCVVSHMQVLVTTLLSVHTDYAGTLQLKEFNFSYLFLRQ